MKSGRHGIRAGCSWCSAWQLLGMEIPRESAKNAIQNSPKQAFANLDKRDNMFGSVGVFTLEIWHSLSKSRFLFRRTGRHPFQMHADGTPVDNQRESARPAPDMRPTSNVQRLTARRRVGGSPPRCAPPHDPYPRADHLHEERSPALTCRKTVHGNWD